MSGSAKQMNSVRFIAAAAAPTVVPIGGAGAVSRKYRVVALDLNGGAVASAEATDATGVTTLDSTTRERITWTNIAHALGGYDIYRTDAIQATNGKIGHVDAGVITFDDTGLVGNNVAFPAANTTGIGVAMSVLNMEQKLVQFAGTFVATIQMQGSIDGKTWIDEGVAATAVGTLDVTKRWSLMRAKQTAFTSGNPEIWIAGGLTS